MLSSAVAYDPQFRDSAEVLSDSDECGAGCRAIICQRCGFCLAHCCCDMWYSLTAWCESVGAEYDDMLCDERLEMRWADDGGKD
jgi:hypothetical protein